MSIELKTMKKSEVPTGRCKKKGSTKEVIQKFINSKMEAAEVIWKGKYSSVSTARTSLAHMIKSNKLPLEVRKYGDRLFLIRKTGEDDEGEE